ncbi:FG-GAP repeat domain-containing protein [Streptomyces sp. NPDC058855]|uniref:FG-GAP repeat domain-containing protein n=1 Tax=Streptomyces sp. NPDC058855 TaxID=3346651 RepID=UPI0036CE6B88
MFARATARRLRLAGCTALALATGMITAGQAVAAEPPVASGKPAAVAPAVPNPGSATAVTLGPEAAARAAGPRLDLNANGTDDLLQRAPAGGWTVRFDDGTEARFTFSAGGTTAGGDFKEVVPVGDLDGNGKPELLTVRAQGGVALWTAEGTGATATGWTSGGWHVFSTVLGAGDLTGDGRLDLLARTHAGSLYLYAGTATAGTTSPYSSPYAISESPAVGLANRELITGYDLNRDGLADVVARTGGHLTFHAGTGNPNTLFAEPVTIGTGWHRLGEILALGDADGSVSLLARDKAGPNAWAYPSLGDGRLGASTLVTKPFHQALGLAGDSAPNGTYGKSSLLAKTADGTLVYYRVNGSHTGFEGPIGFHALGNPLRPSDTVVWASSLTEGADGTALKISGGRLHALRATGDVDLGGGWDAYDTVIGAGDLTADGRGDLLARDRATGDLWLYPGRGTGEGFLGRIKVGTNWDTLDTLAGAGDVTGDGTADLIGRGTDGRLWLYPGTGQSAAPFTRPVPVGSGWQGMTAVVSPGDVNGDGLADLTARDAGGTLWLYPSTGSGYDTRVALGPGWNAFTTLG